MNAEALFNLTNLFLSDPVFIPEVSATGGTPDSITIGWNSAPASVREHIHYYTLVLNNHNNNTRREAIHPANSNMNVFMFANLEPATLYFFKVAACSEFTRECYPFSKLVRATTMDGCKCRNRYFILFSDIMLAKQIKVCTQKIMSCILQWPAPQKM